MSMYVSLFTVTIPENYASELPVVFEATAYICHQSTKFILPVYMTPGDYLLHLVSHVTVSFRIYTR